MSSPFRKSAGCIIATDEPHNVGDPFGSVVISIKLMEGLPARAEIDVRSYRATRRRRVIELSIRRRDRRRIIGEWALHRYDGIFGTDRTFKPSKTYIEALETELAQCDFAVLTLTSDEGEAEQR